MCFRRELLGKYLLDLIEQVAREFVNEIVFGFGCQNRNRIRSLHLYVNRYIFKRIKRLKE